MIVHPYLIMKIEYNFVFYFFFNSIYYYILEFFLIIHEWTKIMFFIV